MSQFLVARLTYIFWGSMRYRNQWAALKLVYTVWCAQAEAITKYIQKKNLALTPALFALEVGMMSMEFRRDLQKAQPEGS